MGLEVAMPFGCPHCGGRVKTVDKTCSEDSGCPNFRASRRGHYLANIHRKRAVRPTVRLRCKTVPGSAGMKWELVKQMPLDKEKEWLKSLSHQLAVENHQLTSQLAKAQRAAMNQPSKPASSTEAPPHHVRAGLRDLTGI